MALKLDLTPGGVRDKWDETVATIAKHHLPIHSATEAEPLVRSR